MVETEVGQTEFEQTLYFRIETDPENDPPTLYHYKKAVLSKGFDSGTFEPIEETDVFSTIDDQRIYATLKFDYYYLDPNGVGLQFKLYYDETKWVYNPFLGFIEVPIISGPVSKAEAWSFEIDQIWKAQQVNYSVSWIEANNLLGKWHVDIRIGIGDGSGWRDWVTLPFTVEGDTEPPEVKILEPQPNNADGDVH